MDTEGDHFTREHLDDQSGGIRLLDSTYSEALMDDGKIFLGVLDIHVLDRMTEGIDVFLGSGGVHIVSVCE
jgi:hypothetical protein